MDAQDLKQHKWIYSGDRLPEEEGRYLVYAKSADPKKPFIYVAFWHKLATTWQGLPIPWASAITHWMPLPESPKEDV